MNSGIEDKAEIARKQSAIRDMLALSDGELLFEFVRHEGKTRLNLVTINPRHSQSFLYHTTEGVSATDALAKMEEYVKSTARTENTYTVQWMARTDRELHTSYFRAKNMYEALDKLYYGRDMNTITVYSMQLNPIS